MPLGRTAFALVENKERLFGKARAGVFFIWKNEKGFYLCPIHEVCGSPSRVKDSRGSRLFLFKAKMELKLFSFGFLGNRLATFAVGLFFCFGASGQAPLMTNTVILFNDSTKYVVFRWQTECSPTPDTLDNVFFADYFLFAVTSDTVTANRLASEATNCLIGNKTSVNELDIQMRKNLWGCNLTEYAIFCAVLQRRTAVVKTN